MSFRDIFIISKGTKVIFTITFSVSLLAVLFAFFYYRNLNRSEDPRIRNARTWLAEYDKTTGGINSYQAFCLLDSAYSVFRSLPDYSSSFEVGLIYNNKCSALLLQAMYDTSITESQKRYLLSRSMIYCDSSISIYRNWIREWHGLSISEITEKISPWMKEDDEAFRGHNYKKIFAGRIRNIISARQETPRRLSVSLSNKGTIYRHMMMPDSSLAYYREALKLWKDNRTAKSNLNVLLGGEPIKPNLIQSLFPPDKNRQ
ncbi:MAG: tetratricopeptide repeat protein [Bacteroidales bacterium]|jgi:tetratricopeptide (TPR) repeat protein|nr:tetratricopeptide repeat protein [Bacteroidales bacterium]